MLEVTLIINTAEGEQTLQLDGNLTVGRTTQADLALPDGGLSRRHAAFERSGEEIWLFDENSTNGTFVNQMRVPPEGVRLSDNDEITLGDYTQIFVQMRRVATSPQSEIQSPKPEPEINEQKSKTAAGQPIPKVLIAAGVFFVAVVSLAGLAILLAISFDSKPGKGTNQKGATPAPRSAEIPIEVTSLRDDEADVDALLDVWEVQEEQLKVEDVRTVTSTNREELNVTPAEWDKQRQRARAGRNLGGSAGSPNLGGRGLAPQFAKMTELGLISPPPRLPLLLPRDFTELSKKRLSGELIEMPLATKDYVLDQIGTSASNSEITVYDPNTNQRVVAAPGSPAFQDITRLAGNFEGQKYNLGDAGDRVEFKRRLLRSIRPEGKQFIEEFARGYREKFNYPLLITSLIRTLEYQVDLAKRNSNATRSQTPPHASGYTFDMAFNQMSGVELRYIYDTLEQYEKAGRIDALFEAGNCIHIFVYPDRKPPKGF